MLHSGPRLPATVFFNVWCLDGEIERTLACYKCYQTRRTLPSCKKEGNSDGVLNQLCKPPRYTWYQNGLHCHDSRLQFPSISLYNCRDNFLHPCLGKRLAFSVSLSPFRIRYRLFFSGSLEMHRERESFLVVFIGIRLL